MLGGGEEVSVRWSDSSLHSLARVSGRWGAAVFCQSVGSGLVCACLRSEGVWAPLWSVD